MSDQNKFDNETLNKLFEENRAMAETPLEKGMDPKEFARVVSARANMVLFNFSHTLKLCRNGLDTYANLMAMLYAAGTISDRVPDLNLGEVFAAFVAGARQAEALAGIDVDALLKQVNTTGPKAQA